MRESVHPVAWRLAILLGVVCAVLTGMCAFAAAEEAKELPKEGASTNVTVITSDRLDFDYEARCGVFEDKVKVINGDMTMDADRIVVLFNPDNSVSNITACGQVCISQSNMVANCQTAACDVVSGVTVLTGEPQIKRGQELMKGDIITITRVPGSKGVKVRAESGGTTPRAYLVLGPDARMGDIRLLDEPGAKATNRPAGGDGRQPGALQ